MAKYVLAQTPPTNTTNIDDSQQRNTLELSHKTLLFNYKRLLRQDLALDNIKFTVTAPYTDAATLQTLFF